MRGATLSIHLLALVGLTAAAPAGKECQSETSFQIRTAPTESAFFTRLEAIGQHAAFQWWKNAVNGDTAIARGSWPRDAASWIIGDIEGRFRESPLMPLRSTLSNTAAALREGYLADFALTLGSSSGRLLAVYGPLTTDTVFNNLRVQERGRAGTVLSDVVLSSISAFAELASSPGVDSVGAMVAYGHRNFLDKDLLALTLKGEVVAIVMPAPTVVAYVNKKLSVDDVVEKSKVVVCDTSSCRTIRPKLP